ncbi:Outer membrane protein TolC [Candidatus Electrothrix aarhusensis]|uniref:Outer membrane protein TolC n=1 Tax=Candidatus Electrothrix aarhusensis TaxID=1859131 RepID=A0A444IQ51_9BACT|nr:Outer membrane protein TolC [Candidatus Electrothrix aarhusensis]
MKQSIIVFIVCFLLAITWQAGQGKETAQTKHYDLTQVELLNVEIAQKIALQENPNIGAAQARLKQAKAALEKAVAADKPRVDASASTGLARYSDTTYDVVSLSDPSADQNYAVGSLGLQASWLLFDGYARKFRKEQARYGVQSSAASRDNTQRILASAVADTFFNAQQALAAIEIAAANKEFYEKQLQDAESRLEVGSGSLSDVLNIKVQLNSAKNSLLTSGRDYEVARYALAALLGLADSVLPKTVKLAELDKDCDIAADNTSADGEKLIAEALQTRPDLTALDMRIKGADSGIEQAKAGDWPTVQLVGKIDGNTQDSPVPAGEDFGASLGVSASWNLYSGGAVDAAVLEARQAKREAKYAYAELRNSIAAEVQQDITRLTAAREQVRLQRETLELVEENRKLAKSEYEAGSASLVRLNEAQRDLTATYGRLVQALVSYQQARHQLLAAVGRNLESFPCADESRAAE